MRCRAYSVIGLNDLKGVAKAIYNLQILQIILLFGLTLAWWNRYLASCFFKASKFILFFRNYIPFALIVVWRLGLLRWSTILCWSL